MTVAVLWTSLSFSFFTPLRPPTISSDKIPRVMIEWVVYVWKYLPITPAMNVCIMYDTLQTKKPNILSAYSTSWRYTGEYAGNIPALVPNSTDSHYSHSQSNHRSTLNISPIYRSPYIREESYMFEYTDNLSGSQDTRISNIPFVLYAVNISGSHLAKIASLVLWLVRIYFKYAGIFWIYRGYTANVSVLIEYPGNISDYLLPIPL